MMKLKFQRAFRERKMEKLKRRSRIRGIHAHVKPMTIKSGPKPRLDHRNYGAWYMKPTEWEGRFLRKSTKIARQECIHRREPRHIEKIVKSSKDVSKIEEKPKKSDTEIKVDDEQPKDQKEIQEPKTSEMDDEELSQVGYKITFTLILRLTY